MLLQTHILYERSHLTEHSTILCDAIRISGKILLFYIALRLQVANQNYPPAQGYALQQGYAPQQAYAPQQYNAVQGYSPQGYAPQGYEPPPKY